MHVDQAFEQIAELRQRIEKLEKAQAEGNDSPSGDVTVKATRGRPATTTNTASAS